MYGVTEENQKATKAEMLADVLKKIENVKTEECIMIGVHEKNLCIFG